MAASFLLKNNLHSILYAGEMPYIGLMAADGAESMSDLHKTFFVAPAPRPVFKTQGVTWKPAGVAWSKPRAADAFLPS